MKKSMEIIKDQSTYYAINMIIDLLSKVSVDTFVSLTYWGEKLTRDPEVKGAIKHVRQFLTPTPWRRRDLHSSLQRNG